RRRPRPEETEGSLAWIWWTGGTVFLFALAALGVVAAVRAGHAAEVTFFGVYLGVMIPISTGILIVSMIISSQLAGGIDFGEVHTAILKAGGLLVVVNTVVLLMPVSDC